MARVSNELLVIEGNNTSNTHNNSDFVAARNKRVTPKRNEINVGKSKKLQRGVQNKRKSGHY